MESTWGSWQRGGGVLGRGTAGVDARYEQWLTPRHLSFGRLMLKTLQVGPKLCFKGDGDSCLEFRIRSLFIGRIMSPNFSQLPVHSWTLPLGYVTSVCKNHQWPCTAYRWKSQVLSLVFRASLVLLHPVFLSSLPGSPLGTLGSCHLEASIVLTFLWISCLGLVHWSPFPTGPAPIQPSKS